MVNKFSFSTAAVMVLAGLVSPALADSSQVPVAHLSEPVGKVLVNAGVGFNAAAASMKIAAGDQIFVGEDSAVTLSYNSCTIIIDKPVVYKVPAQSPCKAGQKTANVPSLKGLVVEPANSHESASVGNGFGMGAGMMVAGVGALAAVGFIVASQDEGGSN